jgi:hypothetical protein
MGMEEIDVQAYLRIFPKSNPPFRSGYGKSYKFKEMEYHY